MPDTGKEFTIDERLTEEAKSMVALAFRNGPIEDVHAGIECQHCAGKGEYSHITQDEMKRIMKNAVNKDLCPPVDPNTCARSISADRKGWFSLNIVLGSSWEQ